jgi:hypothetical protein
MGGSLEGPAIPDAQVICGGVEREDLTFRGRTDMVAPARHPDRARSRAAEAPSPPLCSAVSPGGSPHLAWSAPDVTHAINGRSDYRVTSAGRHHLFSDFLLEQECVRHNGGDRK